MRLIEWLNDNAALEAKVYREFDRIKKERT